VGAIRKVISVGAIRKAISVEAIRKAISVGAIRKVIQINNNSRINSVFRALTTVKLLLPTPVYLSQRAH
jgi:hypothetical protein